MPKRPITVYIESNVLERIKKNQKLREKLRPPGWPKISSYAAHLIEEGLKAEEKVLEEAQNKG
jgi:hypothetical protein